MQRVHPYPYQRSCQSRYQLAHEIYNCLNLLMIFIFHGSEKRMFRWRSASWGDCGDSSGLIETYSPNTGVYAGLAARFDIGNGVCARLAAVYEYGKKGLAGPRYLEAAREMSRAQNGYGANNSQVEPHRGVVRKTTGSRGKGFRSVLFLDLIQNTWLRGLRSSTAWNKARRGAQQCRCIFRYAPWFGLCCKGPRMAEGTREENISPEFP